MWNRGLNWIFALFENILKQYLATFWQNLKRNTLGHVVCCFQSLNYGWLFVTRWTAARLAPLSSTISWSLLKFLSIESGMLSNHLILCCPLLLLPSVFPSVKVLSNESFCITWPKCRSFSFALVLPVSIQGWLLLGLTGLISLQSKGLSIQYMHRNIYTQIYIYM